jgi:lysozyme
MPTTITLGARGADLIKHYETLRLQAYRPTKNDIPTIGWGHTQGVKIGDTCSPEQAELWFMQDTADAVSTVQKLNLPLTQSMFDALVSLVFNVGAGSITSTSTIGMALRQRYYYMACGAFFLWRKQKGADLLGLARRRAKEMVLFLEDGMPSGSK